LPVGAPVAHKPEQVSKTDRKAENAAQKDHKEKPKVAAAPGAKEAAAGRPVSMHVFRVWLIRLGVSAGKSTTTAPKGNSSTRNSSTGKSKNDDDGGWSTAGSKSKKKKKRR
jgi:hypothetical protein